MILKFFSIRIVGDFVFGPNDSVILMPPIDAFVATSYVFFYIASRLMVRHPCFGLACVFIIQIGILMAATKLGLLIPSRFI